MPDIKAAVVSVCINASTALTLLICKFLSQPSQFGSQLGGEDEAFALLVGHPHSLQDLLLRRLLPELPMHDAQEGGEVQLSAQICRKIIYFNWSGPIIYNVTRWIDKVKLYWSVREKWGHCTKKSYNIHWGELKVISQSEYEISCSNSEAVKRNVKISWWQFKQRWINCVWKLWAVNYSSYKLNFPSDLLKYVSHKDKTRESQTSVAFNYTDGNIKMILLLLPQTLLTFQEVYVAAFFIFLQWLHIKYQIPRLSEYLVQIIYL